MPKEITIQPEAHDTGSGNAKYMVTYEVNGVKTNKTVELEAILELLGNKKSAFGDADAERQSFIEWLNE